MSSPPPPGPESEPRTPPPPPPGAERVLGLVAPRPADAAPALVSVANLSKWFGDLVAVSDVSFDIDAGVTALLGPNGAGKSTVLRMLAGLATPSAGTVRVLGRDPRRDPAAAADIGLAPQQEAVFADLTAREFVRASAQLQGVANADAEATRVLEMVELDPTDTRRLPTYSKGMRQRVKLAQAVVHRPKVILLDEPLSGLDPRQRVHMVRLFHDLAAQGHAVIVSSHVLEEVQRFGSNVIVITNGRLAAQGDFREIRAMMDNRPRRLRVVSDRPRSLAAELLRDGSVASVHLSGETVWLQTTDIAAFSRVVAPAAKRSGARLLEVRPTDEDLESVFRYLVQS